MEPNKKSTEITYQILYISLNGKNYPNIPLDEPFSMSRISLIGAIILFFSDGVEYFLSIGNPPSHLIFLGIENIRKSLIS